MSIKLNKKYRRILKILRFNLIVFIFLACLVELILRIVGVPYNVQYEPSENAIAKFDENRGWSYKPDLSKEIKVYDRTVFVHFNEYGIRVSDPKIKLDYSKPSILFIGGSYVMGDGLQYEESIAAQLNKLIGNEYQVVNLGVQAYGSDQSLITLQRFITKFNTKLVVYVFLEQHIERNGNHDRRFLFPKAKFIGTKPRFALDKNKKLYLDKKPKLYKDYYNSYFLDWMNIEFCKIPFPEELTKVIIKKMETTAKANGAEFLMINWRWGDIFYNNFEDLNFDIIDTLEKAPYGWATMRLKDNVHPNAEACKYVAELVFEYVKKNKNLLKEKNN